MATRDHDGIGGRPPKDAPEFLPPPGYTPLVPPEKPPRRRVARMPLRKARATPAPTAPIPPPAVGAELVRAEVAADILGRRNAKARLIGLLIGIVCIPVAVGLIVALGKTTRPVPKPTPTWSWTAAPSTSTVATPTVSPVIPGWKVAYSDRDLAAYDYPATVGWAFHPGLMTGYETKKRILVLRHAVTDYSPGTCEVANGHRAEVGFMTSEGQAPDGAQLADNLAVRWAEARDTEESGEVHGVPDPVRRTVLSPDGKTTIYVSSVTFSPVITSLTECSHPAMRFTAAYKNEANGTSLVLVISSDQGVAGSMSLDVEDQIISSMRKV